MTRTPLDDGPLARWELVSRILDEVLALPPAERADRARALCGKDAALLEDVQRLVMRHEGAQAVQIAEPAAQAYQVETPSPPSADASTGDGALPPIEVDDVPEDGLVGRRIGAYRLISIIATGGMGVVYRGARDDGRFDQQVAIKLLPPWQGSGPIMDRFRLEQQVLASLHHPHIAQLYDGGTDGDGRPYIVMEYVDGLPIGDWCDERRLDLAGRVALVLQVAEALHFAHRNLVIHRDVKPSNVLVDADGNVKLLDFGIAKLVDAESGGLTMTQQSPMTPDYAAPEQVSGQPVTVATDVYQLGMLLYQLLTGRRPYGRTPTSLYDLARLISERPPRLPSSVVLPGGARDDGLDDGASLFIGDHDAQSLSRALHGDLDAIIMKALDKVPEQRYASMAALAEDLTAYLKGMPVEARRQTLAYRTTKLIRRHPWSSASAGVIVCLIIVYAVTATIQAHRIREALAEAQSQARRAETVASFLKDLFRNADPDASGGNTITAREVLDRNRESVLNGLEGEPRIRAELLTTLGSAYLGLGLYPDAISVLERAVEVRRETGSEATAMAHTLAQLGTAYFYVSRFDDADRVLNEATELFPADAPWTAERAATLIALGESLHRRNNTAAAEPYYRTAIDGLKQVGSEQRHALLAMALNNLGSIELDRGMLDDAEASFRNAIQEQQQATGPNSSTYSFYLTNLASILMTQGRYDDARPAFESALAIQRQVLGDEHPYVVESLLGLGNLYSKMGRYADAERSLREALTVQNRLMPDTDSQTARVLFRLGVVLNQSGRPAEARSMLERAVTIDRRLPDPTGVMVGGDLSELGDVERKLGDHEAAREHFDKAIEMLPAGGLWQAEARANYARLLEDAGAPSEALEQARLALDIRSRLYPAGHLSTAESQAQCGLLLHRLGRDAEAAPLLEQALSSLKNSNRSTALQATVQQTLRSLDASTLARPASN